jgi:signal peptidase I
LVQQELHPSDEGREGHGDSGEPRADEAAPGVLEALSAPIAEGAPEAFDGMPAAAAEPGMAVPELAPPPVEGASPDLHMATVEDRSAHAATTDDRAAVLMHRLHVWKDEVVAWFKTLASAAVYATLIVTFGFQVARVEGQSMAPTLADQDRLIVNKLAYRMGDPRRGDIVMLYYPLNPDKSFVKRVIAEEGDQVRIVDGRVFVNDVPMQDDFVPPEYRSHDDFGPSVIPEGYYFVMGDHRNNSSDSRHWGFVPKKYIIGRVQLRWWPIPTAHVF